MRSKGDALIVSDNTKLNEVTTMSEKRFTKNEIIEMLKNARYDSEKDCFIIENNKTNLFEIIKLLKENVNIFASADRYKKDFGEIENKKCIIIGSILGEELAIITD